jgi:hypothetical protein
MLTVGIVLRSKIKEFGKLVGEYAGKGLKLVKDCSDSIGLLIGSPLTVGELVCGIIAFLGRLGFPISVGFKLTVGKVVCVIVGFDDDVSDEVGLLVGESTCRMLYCVFELLGLKLIVGK